jgi:hypothetical protein
MEDLLEKGVIRKSHSQYNTQAFLILKLQEGQRMTDYHLLEKKVVFNAFPMPTAEHFFSGL